MMISNEIVNHNILLVEAIVVKITIYYSGSQKSFLSFIGIFLLSKLARYGQHNQNTYFFQYPIKQISSPK